MSQTHSVHKFETLFMVKPLFFSNRAGYEIMWKDTVQPYRLQMAIECGVEKMKE